MLSSVSFCSSNEYLGYPVLYIRIVIIITSSHFESMINFKNDSSDSYMYSVKKDFSLFHKELYLCKKNIFVCKCIWFSLKTSLKSVDIHSSDFLFISSDLIHVKKETHLHFNRYSYPLCDNFYLNIFFKY